MTTPDPACPVHDNAPAPRPSVARRRWLFVSVAGAAAAAGVGLSWWQGQIGGPASAAPDPFWDLSFPTPGGETLAMRSLAGNPLLLNFWATWCPPCIAEMPDLQELYINKSDRITFVLVSNEKAETINSFMEKKGFTMPVYQELSETPPDFATGSIPTTWVISPEGKIIIRKTGAAKWNSSSMHKLIDQQHPKR